MSKSQQTGVTNQANQQIQQNNANEGAVNSQLQPILSTAEGNANTLLPSITGGYSDIASTGGYDPTVLGNINATNTNLAANGGISPGQVASMEDKASQAAQSTYQTGQAAAERAQAATGGYGVSGSITGSLARQGSEAATQAAQNVSGSIAQIQQQGEIAGAQGLQQTQQAQTGNKLTALAGNTNIYGMNENQVSTTVSQILQNYQQTGQMNAQDMAILTNLANQPGVFDKIVSTIATLGNTMAGIMGAMNPLGGGGGGSKIGGVGAEGAMG
jgi:hypothetical protein